MNNYSHSKKYSGIESPFFYSHLDAESSELVKLHAEVIRKKLQQSVRDIVDIGERLIDVKKLLPHGQFTLWVQIEIGWDIRNAQRFMLVASMFEEKEFHCVSTEELKISPSALYLLSSRTTTSSARMRVIRRALGGETISRKIARAIINDCAEITEKSIEKALVRRLRKQGIAVRAQVSCRVGIADVVTSKAIYEIKLFLTRETIFDAVGQVLLYRQCIDSSAYAIIVGIDGGIKDWIPTIQELGVEVELWDSSQDRL